METTKRGSGGGKEKGDNASDTPQARSAPATHVFALTSAGPVMCAGPRDEHPELSRGQYAYISISLVESFVPQLRGT